MCEISFLNDIKEAAFGRQKEKQEIQKGITKDPHQTFHLQLDHP